MVGKEMQVHVNMFQPWEDWNCVCLVGGIKCTSLVLSPMEGKKTFYNVLCLGCSFRIMKLMGFVCCVFRCVHHVPEVEKDLNDFIEKINWILIQVFPKVMKMMRIKGKDFKFLASKVMWRKIHYSPLLHS